MPEAERVVAVEARPPAVPRLGIEDHGVDLERLDLPLPPVAAGAAHGIGARAAFEHQPLHAPGSRFGPRGGELLPGGSGDERREKKPIRVGPGQAGDHVGEGRGDQGLEPRSPLHDRPRPEILTPLFEQVVGHEHAGDLGEDFLGDRLATRPLREHREGQQPAAGHREQLAVEHGARRQRGPGCGDLREGVVHQFLAPAPDGEFSAAADELGPHAVPLPLGLPVGHGAEILGHVVEGGAVEGRREEEGIGSAAVGQRRLGGQQPREGRPVGGRLAGEPVRHLGLLDAGDLGQGPGHERPRHAHTEAAGEQLVPHDPLPRCELPPHGQHHLPLAVVAGAAEVVDRRLHRLGEAEARAGGGLGRRFGEHERQRLGEVADVGVAFLDEPCGKARRLGRPLAELGGRHAPQLPRPREHGERRGRVVGRSGREVVAKRRHLFGDARGGVEPPVELGERLHAPASAAASGRSSSPVASSSGAVVSSGAASPANRVASTAASSPLASRR